MDHVAPVDDAELRNRFAGAPVARLATVTPAGAPHVVPVTFAVAGDTLYTAVDHKPKSTLWLQRLRNIAAEPRVALLVDRYWDDWDELWWVRADGTAAESSDPAVRAAALALLAVKYPQYRDRPPAGPLVVVAVTRWSGWSAR